MTVYVLLDGTKISVNELQICTVTETNTTKIIIKFLKLWPKIVTKSKTSTICGKAIKTSDILKIILSIVPPL